MIPVLEVGPHRRGVSIARIVGRPTIALGRQWDYIEG